MLATGDGAASQTVSAWRDVIAVSAGSHHTVGVVAGGRALAVGDNSRGQCEVASWSDVVAVAAGSTHTLGLRADGSVLAAGNNDDGQCDTAGWRLK
ncbi:hypothetical protein ACW0JT_17125 [Arthrobacter sp. SA17]